MRLQAIALEPEAESYYTSAFLQDLSGNAFHCFVVSLVWMTTLVIAGRLHHDMSERATEGRSSSSVVAEASFSGAQCAPSCSDTVASKPAVSRKYVKRRASSISSSDSCEWGSNRSGKQRLSGAAV